MATTQPRIENQPDTIPGEAYTGGKMFDNYSAVNVREATGTFFLGVLAILLFIALRRAQDRYEELLAQTRPLR